MTFTVKTTFAPLKREESDFLTAQRKFFADKAKSMREFTGERSKGHDFHQSAYEAYAIDRTAGDSAGAA